MPAQDSELYNYAAHATREGRDLIGADAVSQGLGEAKQGTAMSKRYAYNPDIEHIPDDQTGQGSRLCGQNVTPANLGPAKVSVAISSAPHISLQGDDDDAFDWTDEDAEDFASEHFSEDEVDLLAETGQSHSVDTTEEHRRCFCEPRMRHMLTGRDDQPGDN